MANRLCPFCRSSVADTPTGSLQFCPSCHAQRRHLVPMGDDAHCAIVGLTIKTHRIGTTEFLELVGELDLAGIESLEAAVERAAASDADLAVIDLGRVEFIDTAGVHGLLDACARLADRLRIIPAADRAHRIFRLTETDDQLPFVRGETSDPASGRTVRAYRARPVTPVGLRRLDGADA